MALLTRRASACLRGAPVRARDRTPHTGGLPRRLYVFFLLILFQHTHSHAQTDAYAAEYTEYQLKAAFLFNFAKFVDWPSEAFPDTGTPFVIGVFGDDPFGGSLEQIVRGKNVKGRSLVLRRYPRVSEIDSCHILFISASEERATPQVLEKVRGSSILTVGEVEGFAGGGGVVNFVLRDNHVRFEINVDAAERARLRISSKLLKLADIVRDGTSR